MIVQGDENEIIKFEKKLTSLLDHYHEFNVLTDEIILEILNNELSEFSNSGDGKDILVYGNNGKAIRARTPTNAFWLKNAASQT